MPGFVRRFLSDPENLIDDRLRAEIGEANVDKFSVIFKELPGYRFVDLYRAIESLAKSKGRLKTIESENFENLTALLHGEHPNSGMIRRITRSSRSAWPTGHDSEAFLPCDKYWLFGELGRGSFLDTVVRLRFRQDDERTFLEVACLDENSASRYVHEIIERSLESSIYRNQLLALVYEAGTKDEYGNIEQAERLRISFKVAAPVQDSDFVVDESVLRILWRNVIDLHERRDVLKAHGVPVRRGVLLYGPPGTGKTFACRYICGKLTNTTRIVVTGTALHRVSQIFDLARTYQPSIVILEDVDLVFSARDINLYSSALGDLLDQMDGLRPFEDVGVILTTNSIERMEEAIKDRPGRISQCIYFGPPSEELRLRYITRYARDYDCSSADMDELVGMTRGSTPAFIKEWIHRTAQIASERAGAGDAKLSLATEDFRSAYAEMRHFSPEATGRIIGFLADAN